MSQNKMDKVLIMCTGDKEAGMSTSKKLLEPLLEEYFIKFPNKGLPLSKRSNEGPNPEIERAYKKACVTFAETSNNITADDKLKGLVGGNAFFARAVPVDNKL